MTLEGRVALVTGSSRGVGRGVARALGEAGATVWVTGRTAAGAAGPEPGTVEHVAAEVTGAGGRGIPVRCDHGVDEDVARLFARIAAESGRLDVLVNNAHSGIDAMAGNVQRRFWELEPDAWDRMNRVGLRGHYVASVHAARMMAARGSGLIVNVSSFGAISYLFDTAYGVGKAALDRMTADMAIELEGTGVTVISLWPGLVRTELTSSIIEDATPGYRRIFEAYAESPLLSGRVIAALAADPRVARRSGRVVISGEAAHAYRVRDEDGGRAQSPRSVKRIVSAALPGAWRSLAALVPPGNLPMWIVRPILVRFSEILRRGGYRAARRGTTDDGD